MEGWYLLAALKSVQVLSMVWKITLMAGYSSGNIVTAEGNRWIKLDRTAPS